MRVLGFAVLCCAFSALADVPPYVPRTVAVGFSHAIHARDVAKAGTAEVPCTRCHAIGSGPGKAGLVVGRPDHASCFGSCHGAAPGREPPAPDRLRFCNACHAETALATPKLKGPLAVAYPPYTLAPDHALELSHATHAGAPCTTCHAPERPRKGLPHARCASCHEVPARRGKGPAMAACTACHVEPTEAPPAPRMRPADILVATAFSHARHATRGAAKQCATCHAGVADARARELPRPDAARCATAGCHDDKASFGITAACTRCHQDVPSGKVKLDPPRTRFSHATHATTGLACATCHPIGTAGEVLVANHAPCVTCHADDFGQRAPKYCGACHNSTEPWRPLKADRLPPDTTEFGATLEHVRHGQIACTSCHVLNTPRTELRPPRGHAACTTAGCHAVATGPAPRLGSCEGCHALGLVQQRERARRAPTWSVRATFVHAPHRTTKRGEPIACTTCHTDLGAKHVRDLVAPGKQTCMGCHDGKDAFKLTGTSCTRCHPGATGAPR